jgi:glutamine synthetase
MYDGVIADSGLGPVGEVYLQADLDTITPLPYSPGHARAMADMIKDGQPWECSTRGFLKKMIKKLKNHDLEIKASFENEFYILDNENKPLDDSFFASTLSMDKNRKLVREIVRALEAQDMIVEQYYPEAGPGQHEITLKYAQALMAADNQIKFRETINAVALQYGLQASFLPKLFSDKSGNGTHLHLSLWKDGVNLTPGEQGLSEIAAYFIAGILHHLPALLAITAPTTNSYRRIIPQNWAGAYQCWGYDNREAGIRVVTDSDGLNKQFELKAVDATSNPYLALGCVLAAGMDGISNQMKLPPSVQVDPALIPENERPTRLPENLRKSLTFLEEDSCIIDAMGKPLARAYLAVKHAELEATKSKCLKEEVKLLKNKY